MMLLNFEATRSRVLRLALVAFSRPLTGHAEVGCTAWECPTGWVLLGRVVSQSRRDVTIAETTVEPAAETAAGAGVAWSRVWNHLAGGKDAYSKDRQVADALERALVPVARPARLARVRLSMRSRLVQHLAVGLDQFLVVGTDLPVALPLRDEVHLLAQAVNPAAQVVYLDDDPLVLAYARGLLCTYRGCACAPAAPDDPGAVLAGAAVALDLGRPVGVLLINTLDRLSDQDAAALVRALRAGLAAGSRLAVVHLTGGLEQAVALAVVCGRHGLLQPQLRTPQEIAALVGPAVTEFNDPGPAGLGLWCGITEISESKSGGTA